MGEIGEAIQMDREAIDRMTEGMGRYQSVVLARRRAKAADERLAALMEDAHSEEDVEIARLAREEAQEAVQEALAALRI